MIYDQLITPGGTVMTKSKKPDGDNEMDSLLNGKYMGKDSINFMELAASAKVPPYQAYRYLCGVGFKTATAEEWPIMRRA